MTRLNITLYTALPAAETIININKQLIQDGGGNGGDGVPGEDRDHGMGVGVGSQEHLIGINTLSFGEIIEL